MKIKITRTPNDWFETEGIRVVLTIENGSQITLVQPLKTDNILHIHVDGELVIYPRASNACELGIK
jgi:hypothetical protein